MSASPPAASAASQGGAAQAQQQLSVPRRLGGRSTLSHSSGFLNLGDVRYAAAPEFIVSSLQSKGTPVPHISLIKVPPFVAAAWRASQPHELLGVLYGENERRRILCRSVKSATSASPSGGATSVNSSESGTSGSAARNQQQQQQLQSVGEEAAGKKPEGMPHAPAPMCELQCASIKRNNHLLVLQQQAPPRRQPQEGDEEEGDGDHSSGSSSSSDSSSSSGAGGVGGEGGGGGDTAAAAAAAKNPASADVLCVIDETYNFVPRLDQKYHNFLRQRHECVNVHKTRATVEEKRREAGLDSTATLFHFYQPTKAGPSSMEDDRELGSLMSFNPRSAPVSAEKAKSLKPKKPLVTMDEDSLKVQLFKAFENAGASGLQLKQLAQYTQQPLTFLRSVVEEIAEPRKRASDRKTVYFLKDQYNPYASLAGEEPLGKKSKLV